ERRLYVALDDRYQHSFIARFRIAPAEIRRARTDHQIERLAGFEQVGNALRATVCQKIRLAGFECSKELAVGGRHRRRCSSIQRRPLHLLPIVELAVNRGRSADHGYNQWLAFCFGCLFNLRLRLACKHLCGDFAGPERATLDVLEAGEFEYSAEVMTVDGV